MDGAIDPGEPSYSGGDNCCHLEGNITYCLGLYFVYLLFVSAIIYTSYICKRRMVSFSTNPFGTISDGTDDYHIISLPQGLCDDVLSTFPTFLYSDVVLTSHKGGTGTDTNTHAGNYDTGCPICLVDYKSSDVLRLLPECAHFFHSSCIDTWLKVHPTCPVCRKLFDFTT